MGFALRAWWYFKDIIVPIESMYFAYGQSALEYASPVGLPVQHSH